MVWLVQVVDFYVWAGFALVFIFVHCRCFLDLLVGLVLRACCLLDACWLWFT